MSDLIVLFVQLERQLMTADEAVRIAGDRAHSGQIPRAMADVLHISRLVANANRTARALVTEALTSKLNESNSNA
jgi:hypothetical protein